MTLFTSTFKLYAYKQYDRCDLSIMVNEYLVLTFRLTHSELTMLLNDYTQKNLAENKFGAELKSLAGQNWFVMYKGNLNIVRLTVGANGVDYNFRVPHSEWELLKLTYEQQMLHPMEWDSK